MEIFDYTVTIRTFKSLLRVLNYPLFSKFQQSMKSIAYYCKFSGLVRPKFCEKSNFFVEGSCHCDIRMSTFQH